MYHEGSLGADGTRDESCLWIAYSKAAELPLLLVTTTPLSLALESCFSVNTNVDPLADSDVFHWSLLGVQLRDTMGNRLAQIPIST